MAQRIDVMPSPDPRRPRVVKDPDQEALEILLRLTERAQVARSFARLTAGIVQQSAARASVLLKVYADAAVVQVAAREPGLVERLERAKRVARAAAEAAVHVATQPRRPNDAETPPQEGPAAEEPSPSTAAEGDVPAA